MRISEYQRPGLGYHLRALGAGTTTSPSMIALDALTCQASEAILRNRSVQSKGRKDRYVMLPREVLDLLRQWWKVRPSAYDAGVDAAALPQGPKKEDALRLAASYRNLAEMKRMVLRKSN
jgi:integrase